jgi:hypothetical protein
MATKLTRLTHKIAIQLHLVAKSSTVCVLAPGGQSGYFWITLLFGGGIVLMLLHLMSIYRRYVWWR